MGESLIGRLKGVLAKKSPSESPSSTSPVEDASTATEPSVTPVAASAIQPAEAQLQVTDASALATPAVALSEMPVQIEFRALVPTEAAALEIVDVSRRGTDCLDATAKPSGRSDFTWQVALVLSLPAHPDQIRSHEELLGQFSTRLGGRVDGWQMRRREAA